MFVSALLVVSLVSAAPADAPPEAPAAAPAAAPSPRVEFVFGGDIIPHGFVKKVAATRALAAAGDASGAGSLNQEGWGFLFEPLAGELRAADVAVVNLETPISANLGAPTAPFIFNAPPMLAHALVASGVDVVSMANNHAFDQRREGIVDTWSALDTASLAHVGSSPTEAQVWEPLIVERNGLRVGLLSLTRWLNGASNPEFSDEAPQVAYVPYAGNLPPGPLPEAVAALVTSAARRCDALIVLVHWGTEYSHSPHPEDRDLARRMLEAGALAVVGHHPHVLQPVERYRTSTGRDTLVAFSLGNLLANQEAGYVHGPGTDRRGRTRDSILLKFALTRSAPDAPVELVDPSLLPVWIDTNHALALRDRDRKARIQPVLIDVEQAALEGRLSAIPPEDKSRAAGAQRRELTRRIEMAQRRRALIQQVTQPPAVEPGPRRRASARAD